MFVMTIASAFQGYLQTFIYYLKTPQLCLEQELRLEVPLCFGISFTMFPPEEHPKQHHRKSSISGTFWHPVPLS